MKDFAKIKAAILDDIYTQGINTTPLYMSGCGWSIFDMKKYLGFCYKRTMYYYSRGYGEMYYFNDELERLWKIIKNKLAKDKNYLRVVKKIYEDNFNRHYKCFKELEKTDLSTVSDERLLAYLKEVILSQTDSVGVGHIIEPIGQHVENDFKKLLEQEFGRDMLNSYFILLSVPSKLSFIAEEENDLCKIKKLKKDKQEAALRKHYNKYFWINNSYRGPSGVTVEDFKKRMKEAKFTGNKDLANKKKLLATIKLSKAAKELMEIIDFTTTWQDERKINILKTVHYMGMLHQELARRLKIDKKALWYFSVTDSFKIKKLSDIKALEKTLSKRQDGIFSLWENEQVFECAGDEFKKLKEILDSKTNQDDSRVINGSIANGGTVIGKVVICSNISNIHKVAKGDILVSPMTRPEYMPAIKKAAAIVTDEGGITCHAAIVARELGIPAVIGTKVATKVLKDGMEVEVRANHGFVRILS